MKKRFIIANWKSNKTRKEVIDWVDMVEKNLPNDASREIIVCPSTIYLQYIKEEAVARNIPIRIGAQDISAFSEGPYTGDVNGKQLTECVAYVLIGHSERRKYYHEDDQTLNAKIRNAQENNIIPIYCVSSEQEIIPQGVEIAAYEPIEAIGTGNPDTPENANTIAKRLKQKNNLKSVLYGGSVTSANVGLFTSQEHIDGALVGGASLDAKQFLLLVKNA